MAQNKHNWEHIAKAGGVDTVSEVVTCIVLFVVELQFVGIKKIDLLGST